MAPAMKMSFFFRRFLADELGIHQQGIVSGYFSQEGDLLCLKFD